MILPAGLRRHPQGDDFIIVIFSAWEEGLISPRHFHLLDAIAGRQFRTEVEALGGYDMTETGKMWSLRSR
jgi:hypothetical protein